MTGGHPAWAGHNLATQPVCWFCWHGHSSLAQPLAIFPNFPLGGKEFGEKLFTTFTTIRTRRNFPWVAERKIIMLRPVAD
jgi:hypothetical protein